MERMKANEAGETESTFGRQASSELASNELVPIDRWDDRGVVMRARSLSLLRIIEPLASRGLATARYKSPVCPDSDFRYCSDRPCRQGTSILQDRYAAYATPATSTRISRLVRKTPLQTPNSQLDDGHTATVLINVSYQLIADWNRRLTRSPPLSCTFARHSRIASAFQDRGRREQNLKNHKRHALAMTFVQRFLRSVRLSDDDGHAVRKAIQSKGLNLRG
jgi:hypothetical protein